MAESTNSLSEKQSTVMFFVGLPTIKMNAQSLMEKTSVVIDWSALLTVHLYGNVQSSVLSMHHHTKLLYRAGKDNLSQWAFMVELYSL